MMLSDSARKVQDALEHFGLTLRVVEMPQTTRTAKDAAQAIGCTVAQIGKSIIFKGKRESNSGSSQRRERVDEKIIARMAVNRLRKPAPSSFASQPDL